MRRLAWLFALLPLALQAGEPAALKPKTRISGSLQTGFASNFQLTLGGTFGAGPAWQDRVTLDVNHVWRRNDAITVSGWMTFDMPSHSPDWLAGIGYRTPLIERPGHVLEATVGYQRWRFPSVACGTQDHLVAANLTYKGKWKVPLTVTADNWSLLHSNMPKGTLLYLQGFVSHVLWSGDNQRLVLRHGPATTYSANFYGKQDWRVLRYQGYLAYEIGRNTIEGGLRQQKGLITGLPDNLYWSVLLTRRF